MSLPFEVRRELQFHREFSVWMDTILVNIFQGSDEVNKSTNRKVRQEAKYSPNLSVDHEQRSMYESVEPSRIELSICIHIGVQNFGATGVSSVNATCSRGIS